MGKTRELHRAVRNGNFTLVSNVIENKVVREQRYSIDVLDEYNWTPLIWHGFNNELEIAKLLIYSNADVNCKNLYGNSLLWHACENGKSDLVNILVTGGADVTALLAQAEQEGNLEIIRNLIRAGVLHEAVRNKTLSL